MLWFYSFFPITNWFSVSTVTMHICRNLFKLLSLFPTLNRKWSFKNCLHIIAALTSHSVLICFCLCCVYCLGFFFFFSRKQEVHPFFFSLLVKCCIQTVIKDADLVLFNDQHVWYPGTVLLPCSYIKLTCYVYCYASSLMNTCQEI